MENKEAYNVCHACQLAGMRNCGEFDKCGNTKSYPFELRHLIEVNHLNNVSLSISCEQSYNIGYTDNAQQSTAKYVEIVEGEIKRLDKTSKIDEPLYTTTKRIFGIELLTDLLTKLKNS